jgi:glycosyltransferase involved in cell wall biosynthesis
MVVGISMVKDEADVIEATIEHMREQCDGLLIADNDSTDGTGQILAGLVGNLIWLRQDHERAYYQSEKMSHLADFARRKLGATWVVPFDADERWLANDGRVADLLMDLPPEAMTCEATVFDHVATGDPEMPWRRREALPLRKVACRAVEGLVIHQGNHGATFPNVRTPLAVTGRLEVRHSPYRSPEQFIRKVRNGAAAYAATTLPEEVGRHWREYGRLTDEQLREVFDTWFSSTDPENDPDLVFDPCPVLSRS